VNIHTSVNTSAYPIKVSSVENLVSDFIAFHHTTFDEASIHFVDTPTICDLHEQFFNDPSTTDCISFPMDDAEEEGYRILGDVFVCPETADNYVKSNGGDLYHEITLYVVHGLLHLLGYDDIEEDDQVLMRAEEARYLKQVAAKNLWLHP
jgi:probable rRNA maturation factor